MNKIALLLFVFAVSWCWAGPKPDPSQYTINVHVSNSLLLEYGEQFKTTEMRLRAVIDGKKYVLQGAIPPKASAFKIGDYRARVVKDESASSAEYRRTYELLLPDGETRRYDVYGEEE